MGDLLTQEDLERITGAKRPAKQAEVLKQAGIYYWWGLDKALKTTWHHVHAAGAAQPPRPSAKLPAMDLVR